MLMLGAWTQGMVVALMQTKTAIIEGARTSLSTYGYAYDGYISG